MPTEQEEAANKFYAVWSPKEAVILGASAAFERAAQVQHKHLGDAKITRVHKATFLHALHEGKAIAMLERLPE